MVELKPMILIGAAIMLLIGPGIIFNNLTASGYNQAGEPNLGSGGTHTCGTYTGNYYDPTCQGQTAVGCQAVASACQLNGTTVSFLNSCSPFTQLLQLNFVQFISLFFNSCSGGTFSQGAQNPSANFPQTGNVTLPGLKATYGFHTISGQVQWKSSLATHPITQGIVTPYYLTCLTFAGTLSTGQKTYPCNWVDSATPTPNGETMSCWLFGNSTDVNNAICNNWAYSQAGGGTSQLVTNLLQGNILGFFMSLVGGIMLLILGLGVDVGAATVNIGSNAQGSRFAQAFGIGLLIWGPLYSEFSTWFESGILPNGLDGATGVISVLLIGSFFGGVWWLSSGRE